MPDASKRNGESWSTHQLTEFLALIASFEDERSAMGRAIERAAEALDAEVAAVIDGDGIVASVGLPGDKPPLAELREVAAGTRSSLHLPDIGEAHATAAAVDEEQRSCLIVARRGDPFAGDEFDLLRGMGRVLALGLRTLRLVDVERALRSGSESQGEENARLLVALRERQVLLERLGSVQRAIVAKRALHEVFDAIVEGACELTGDDVAVLRLRDPDGGNRTTVVASLGVGQDSLASGRRAEGDGLGTRAIAEGRLIVADARAIPGRGLLPTEWAAEGLWAGMAAPVFERGEIVGSLGVASRDPAREYSARDQQVLIAFAEHASLALNHARALDDVAHQAFHDSLTGMPNRALFLDRIGNALARAQRSGAPVGVLFVDLDDFKTVNDSLGHRAGDALLVKVAARLAACLRPADTIARLGGDEFAVLLDDLGEGGDAARAAKRLLEALQEPFSLEEREVYIGASIGIAAGSADAETLLRDADLAMYRAKAEGKGRYEAFEPGMHTEIVNRLELEVDLKRGIEREELELSYQPIFSLRTGSVSGLEALVRWRHPTRGLLYPDSFIPLAETSGRIHELGRWVLHKACHQAALWRAKYPSFPGIQVGVNVSAAQLREPTLAAAVAGALDAAQLEPEGLTLEITETALMSDMDAAVRQLAELKELGVEIAIDDFGVGYSSLRYLQQLPLDNIKIPKPFLDEIERPDPHPPILRAILELADVFGLRPVAEGIERPEQQARLLELGCELGQGHLLSEAISASAADDMILRVGLLGGPTVAASAEAEDDDLSRSRSSEPPAAAS